LFNDSKQNRANPALDYALFCTDSFKKPAAPFSLAVSAFYLLHCGCGAGAAAATAAAAAAT
jgi:hypothetical protein